MVPNPEPVQPSSNSISGDDVQDNSREKALTELLGLTTVAGRNGFDAEDAAGNPFELKTTSVKDVGTGRDVGRAFIRKLRRGYFVAAKTAGSSTAGSWQPAEVIFCHPSDLEDWIQEKLESRIALDEALEEKVLLAADSVLTAEEKARVKYLMDRGMTYNNPKISWEYLLQHGVLLDLTRPVAHVAELVAKRPLQ